MSEYDKYLPENVKSIDEDQKEMIVSYEMLTVLSALYKLERTDPINSESSVYEGNSVGNFIDNLIDNVSPEVEGKPEFMNDLLSKYTSLEQPGKELLEISDFYYDENGNYRSENERKDLKSVLVNNTDEINEMMRAYPHNDYHPTQLTLSEKLETFKNKLNKLGFLDKSGQVKYDSIEELNMKQELKLETEHQSKLEKEYSADKDFVITDFGTTTRSNTAPDKRTGDDNTIIVKVNTYGYHNETLSSPIMPYPSDKLNSMIDISEKNTKKRTEKALRELKENNSVGDILLENTVGKVLGSLANNNMTLKEYFEKKKDLENILENNSARHDNFRANVGAMRPTRPGGKDCSIDFSGYEQRVNDKVFEKGLDDFETKATQDIVQEIDKDNNKKYRQKV